MPEWLQTSFQVWAERPGLMIVVAIIVIFVAIAWLKFVEAGNRKYREIRDFLSTTNLPR